MTLLAPLGLLALLSLPLIVVLHLLRERRRRVVVPSLLLWQLLPQRQESQRRRKLQLTLLLLLHLLAAALLSLALAGPQWLASLFGAEQHLALIIDTSASMAAPAGVGQGSRLDVARARARALVASLGGRDHLSLIAAGPEAQMIDSASPAGAVRLLAALDHLSPGGSGSDIAGALTLAAADMQGQPTWRVIVISDAALPSLETELRRAPQGLAVSWEQVGAARPNRALITLAARPQARGGLVQVYARAANYSDSAMRSVVRLYGDGQLLDTRPASFPPQAEVELTWSIPSGVSLLRAELDGADDLPADDVASLSLASSRPLRTLLVSASPALIERALKAIPGLSLQVIHPDTYADQARPGIDLTIFDSTLPVRWPAGAVLAINPPAANQPLGVSTSIITSAPDVTTLKADPATAIFAGLSLGGIDFGPIRTISPPGWAKVLLTRDGLPLILRGSVERSEVAVWAFDLGQGNLSTRLAFPLLLVRTLRDLTPAALPASALAGQALELRPDPRADTLEISAPDGTVQRLALPQAETLLISLDEPGIYALRELAGADAVFAGQIPVNVGSARESDLTPRRLPAATTAPPARPDSLRTSQPLWPWLVTAALAVMLGEWVYVHGRGMGAKRQATSDKGT